MFLSSSSPRSRRAERSSNSIWIPSHSSALEPKRRASRRAVSAVIPRRPRMISEIRLTGTSSRLARALAERSRGHRTSSSRIFPGCTGSGPVDLICFLYRLTVNESTAPTTNPIVDSPHDPEPPRGVQRRGDRDPHHDHGAGAPRAARRRRLRPSAAPAGLPELRAELRFSRDLLEQPPPHAPHRRKGQRQDALGERPPALLAVPHSFHDGAGWGRTARRPCRRPSTAGCSSSPRSPTRFSRARSSLRRAPVRSCKAAVQGDSKGKISILAYAAAIPAAFVDRRVSIALYVFVALMWLVPDRRIESKLGS